MQSVDHRHRWGKISRRNLKLLGRVALLCGMVSCACGNALAALLTQVGEGDSYFLQNDGTVYPNVFNEFLGSLSDGSRYNAFYIFALPPLPAGEGVVSADLEYQFHDIQGTPTFNADLYGVGFQGSTAAINMFSVVNTPDAGATKLQDDLMTPSTGPVNGLLQTSAAGDAQLATYLQSFYDANPGYAGGQYVFLRMNPDANPGTGDTYYRVYGGNVNGEPILSITTIPEPGTCAMVLMALGVLAWKRRKRE